MQVHPKMIFDRNNWSLAAIRLFKHISGYLSKINNKMDNKVLIILGCQRSGTSLIYWIFERDWKTKIFREKSILSSRDTEGLRLNPYRQVLREFEKHGKRLIIIKPLVESQNAHLLLSNIPNSQILWMYRHYNDVVSSNLKAFGRNNGIDDLRPIVYNQRKNWRCQKVSDETQATICKHFSESMNPFDAAALYWYARNQLFFDRKLYIHQKVLLCKYEDLVSFPEKTMKMVYRFMGYHYPGNRILKAIHSKSVGKGKSVNLSKNIAQLCGELLSRLDDCYRSKGAKVHDDPRYLKYL